MSDYQRVKRFTLPVNHGPQDFLMGRVLHISPAGHHPNQTDITSLWVWAIERTGSHPIRANHKTLQAFQDNEQPIPASARHIATVLVPFQVHSAMPADVAEKMSPSFVWHVFQLNVNDGDHHSAGIGYDYSIITDPPHTSSNVINQIIGSELDDSMAAAYRMNPRSAAAL